MWKPPFPSIFAHIEPCHLLRQARDKQEAKVGKTMSGFVCRKHTLQAGVSIFAFDIHEKVNMAMSEIHNTNVPGTHY